MGCDAGDESAEIRLGVEAVEFGGFDDAVDGGGFEDRTARSRPGLAFDCAASFARCRISLQAASNPDSAVSWSVQRLPVAFSVRTIL